MHAVGQKHAVEARAAVCPALQKKAPLAHRQHTAHKHPPAEREQRPEGNDDAGAEAPLKSHLVHGVQRAEQKRPGGSDVVNQLAQHTPAPIGAGLCPLQRLPGRGVLQKLFQNLHVAFSGRIPGLGLAVLPGRRPGMHGRKAKPSHQNANQHAHGHNAAIICFQRVPGGLFPLFWLPHF